MKVCIKCGQRNPDNNYFCGQCGEKLDNIDNQSIISELQFPKKLKISDYENPRDRKYIQGLSKKGPIVKALRELNKNWNNSEIKKSLLGNGVRVSGKQFPEINKLNMVCSEIADIKPPEIFITQNPSLNAFTMGIKPYYVVLTSSIVDFLEERELSFVLGHEIGHIKSGHVKYLQLAQNWLNVVSKTSTVASQIGYFVNMWVGMGLSWLSQNQMKEMLTEIRSWQREGEITADRLGLIVAQDKQKAATSLIKLALGSGALARSIDIDEYLKQYKELSKDIKKKEVQTDDENTHPYTAYRVEKVLKWAKSKKYANIFRPENLKKINELVCPNCQNKVDFDDIKCPKCGIDFYECEFCSAIVTEDLKNCPVCKVEFE